VRAALVHDWLTGMRGGEKVLESMARIFPDAPIYTLVHHRGEVSAELERHEIRTSFIQRLPARSAYRWYLPLFPRAIESFDFTGYDLVFSSSHCAAKAVITPAETVHLCYCHTPMRYAWDQFDAYFSPQRNGRLKFALIRRIIGRLREWDRRTADRVHAFAANSDYVADRIRRYYGRDAEVIPPPVDTDRFSPSGEPPGDYYLMVTALSPYKRIDMAIDAFNRMRRPLVVVGWGPERARLDGLAGPTVRLAGKVSDAELTELYRGCRGLILPGIEDAGIAPLEAMACGRPALVLAQGGAPEAVIDGETGVHIPEPTVDALIAAVDTAEGLSFNTGDIRAHAERYSTRRFEQRLREFIDHHCLPGASGSRRPSPPSSERTT
jgi:glycosyltransferase involved in cell wall biosynthesis